MIDVSTASDRPHVGVKGGKGWGLIGGQGGTASIANAGQAGTPVAATEEQGLAAWTLSTDQSGTAWTPSEGQDVTTWAHGWEQGGMVRTSARAHFGTESRSNEFYAAMGLLGVLSVLGVAGNLLVLWVFRRKKDKFLSTLFIMVLAILDLTTCLVIIPYTIYMEAVQFVVDSDFVCKLYQFLITSNIPFSAFIMVVIAVDRYFCICHPFVPALSERKAKLLVLALALAASALGVCVALMHGVSVSLEKYIDSNATNAFKYRLSRSQTPQVPMSLSSILGTDNVSEISEVSFTESTASDEVSKAYASLIYPEMVYLNDGKCRNNEQFLSETFLWFYHKLYVLLFLACLLVIVVLYVLIYRAVLQRRARRQRQMSASRRTALPPRHGTTTRRGSTARASTELDTLHDLELVAPPPRPRDEASEGWSEAQRRASRDADRSDRPSALSGAARDRLWVANLKTAGVLFVVTVVFVVTFLPAFLMTLDVLPHSVLVFNLYFANNVANPFIYSFMNKNFRDDLRALLCTRRGGVGAPRVY